jgi:hypothetical protein
MHDAMRRFCVTARTYRPSRDRLSSSAIAMQHRRASEDDDRDSIVGQHERWSSSCDAAGKPDGVFDLDVLRTEQMVRTANWISIRLMPQVASRVSSGRP